MQQPAKRATECSPGRVREPWVRNDATMQARAQRATALRPLRRSCHGKVMIAYPAVARCAGLCGLPPDYRYL